VKGDKNMAYSETPIKMLLTEKGLTPYGRNLFLELLSRWSHDVPEDIADRLERVTDWAWMAITAVQGDRQKDWMRQLIAEVTAETEPKRKQNGKGKPIRKRRKAARPTREKRS
jgi:hypothetical protein